MPTVLVNSVPASLRNDPSLILARAEARQRAGDSAGAAKIFLEAPRDPKLLVDPDEWWREARVMVRGLLDRGDPQTAYRLAAHVGTPEQENYKADQQFTAGWVALRFLRDPSTAAKHFKSIESFSIHPTTLSRGLYWLGRAQEAAGDRAGAKAAYERAAPYSTTYYGQLARARLGLKELAINRPLEPNAADRAQFGKLESVRALRLLHAAGEKDLAIPFYVDLSERLDQPSLLLLAAVAYEQRDPRGMVLVGKGAHARGILIDTIAFPIFGIPEHPKDEPAVERSVVYAIARQESQFNQAAVSTANAYGLMQVITPTAKAIAKRIGVPFDASKLKGDPAYNARLGAAELGHLLRTFNGSYILAFSGYNAGPGRAREWIGRYGDPRDPKVDAVDWIERIPISETRYYIQRIMENMQVYRVLLGDNAGFRIEADLVPRRRHPLTPRQAQASNRRMSRVSPNEPVSSYYFVAPDGLKLHALAAGPRASPWLPVICLPGIARTSEDFRETIEALAFDPERPRRVLALDSRGRGLSARDPNPDNYSVPVELGDVLALLDANAIERAIFIGTSRGGILTMTMSMAQPALDRRRGAERHRPGNRDGRAAADQELRRQAAKADLV